MSAPEGFRRHLGSQVGWYLLVGTIGFAADAGAYLLFSGLLEWPAVPSRLAAFLPATLVTWAINRNLTFARDDSTRRGAGRQYLRYLAVQGGGIAVSFFVFYAVLSRFPAHDLTGLALGSIAALLFNFAGSRLLVFRGRAVEATGDRASAARSRRWLAQALAVATFGVVSVVLGQDANWDLANYHLYNPYAFLNGRLQVDLAAAGFQSYFNPVLDLPYFWMAMNLPAPVVAFIMGALHGLALPLVAAVIRHVLPQAPAREVWLLALAGCLGATFLSELGNSMGDNTTALLVLVSLLSSLRVLPAPGGGDRGAASSIALAGLLMGAACGLKLTNAIYAVGLVAALLLLPVPGRRRLVLGAVFAATASAGLALTAGYWLWAMWAEFGNPLFPQFNGLFGSPMAASIGSGDPRWGPKGAVEALLYPFVFTFDPRRFGETPLLQLLWPVAYVLFIAWALAGLMRRRPASPSDAATNLVLTFLAISYCTWLAVFGIGRYTVAIELLLPLAVWVLLRRLAPAVLARRLGKAVIMAAVVVSVLPFKTWGHAPFGEASYSVRVPAISNPARATVLLLAQPVAWIVVFFPPELAFVSMFNFPESPAYHRRAAAILQARGGDIWAIVPAAVDTAGNTVARFNEWAQRHELAADAIPCRAVAQMARRSTRYRKFAPQPGAMCRFEVPFADRRDLERDNRTIAQDWAMRLRVRELLLEPESCRRHEAFIGALAQPYQFCRVSRVDL